MGQRSQAEQKRRVKKIGKVLGGQKDGVICFNGGFLQERPEFRNFLVERKGEEYICTPLNESGIPFFYRTFDGKIPDVKTVRQVISGNAGLSLNNVVFVSDRGYSDAKNIKDCLRNKLGFLFNVQCEMPGSFAQELIDEERENLRDLNRMDWLTKVFQITKEINWTFEPDLVQGQVSSKKTKESRYFTGTSISID